MSRETLEFLNNNTLIGFTDKRGNAWHRDLSLVSDGLDNHYAGAIPAEDILSRLFGWKAEPRAVYIDGGSAGLIRDESKTAWVRNDTNGVLGYHSQSYHGHDYSEWLVQHLTELVGTTAQFANAGLLKGGADAWVQIELPDNVTIGNVVIRPFLLAATSFDGSLATSFKRGMTNVVCDNTMAMFMREDGEQYKRKHTRNSAFDVMDAASAVGTLEMIAERASADIGRLMDVDVSDRQWQQFVEAHVPLKDGASKQSATMAETERAALTGLWRTDMRVAPWSGTGWGVMQAVNTYREHMSIVRNMTREERKMTRAVKDEIAPADRQALMTLSTVIGRDLLTV